MSVRRSLEMRRLIYPVLVLMFLGVQGVVAGPKIQTWVAEKGGRVLFVPTEGLPVLDARLLFDAGSAREGKEFGLASLTANLLMSGSGDQDADAIASRLDAVGAQISTGASRDSAFIALRTLTAPRQLAEALEIFKLVVAHPRFDKKDFDRERSRVLLGIRQRGEDPSELAEISFMQALYGDHPYAHPVDGQLESVEKLTEAQALQFHKSLYTARNGTLVLVGEISREQAEALAAGVFSGLPEGLPSAPLEDPIQKEAKDAVRISFPSEQTHVRAGLLGVKADDPDYFPLVVGNHILGGSGLVSRIMEEVREKRGLAYSAYSYFLPMRVQGPFEVGLESKNASAGEALAVALRTLRDFVEKGPTEKALAAAKKNIVGGYVLRLDSNAKLIGEIAAIASLGRPLDWLDTYTRKVEAVTAEEVRKAYKRRVDPDKLQVILVGDGKAEVSGSPQK